MKDYKNVGHRLQNVLIPLTTVIDIYLLVPLIKGHPKSAWPIHPIQGRYLMGKWLGYIQKYFRNHIAFLGWGILSREEQQRPKRYPRYAFKRFLFTCICLGHLLENFVVSAFFITKVCSVHILELQKFVMSAFWRLQKFVVSAFKTTNPNPKSAFWDYKSL